MYFLGLGGVGAAIYLRESGIYVWDFFYLVYFFTFNIWLFAQIVVISWTTEKTKNVRVYLGVRRFIFIHE